MVSYKVMRFFVDQKYKKETRDPDMSSPYVYIRYKLFIAHLFLMTISYSVFRKKSSFQIGDAICLLFYLIRGQKGPKFRNITYLKGTYNFYFASTFDVVFCCWIKGLCWVLLVVYRHFPLSFTEQRPFVLLKSYFKGLQLNNRSYVKMNTTLFLKI